MSHKDVFADSIQQLERMAKQAEVGREVCEPGLLAELLFDRVTGVSHADLKAGLLLDQVAGGHGHIRGQEGSQQA